MWAINTIKKQKKTNTFTIHAQSLDAENEERKVKVRAEFFEGREAEIPWQDKKGTQEFTYGYAITVHKAQGSQWDSVLIFDESRFFREESARHLYTAITRAAQKVTVVR